MLPGENRLLAKSGFQKVKEKGKMLQSKSFGVSILKRRDEKPTKFGFVVSTKISNKAVKRNRVKRLLKEAVKENLDSLVPGYDVVFLAKGVAPTTDLEGFSKEVKDSLKEARVLK